MCLACAPGIVSVKCNSDAYFLYVKYIKAFQIKIKPPTVMILAEVDSGFVTI